MSAQTEIQQARTITELRGFIKKLLYDHSILATSLDIARRHGDDPNADEHIAEEISNSTSINIPSQRSHQSAGDKLFLELLKEVIEEESALY